MSLKRSALSAIMIVFSCSVLADDALLKSIEANSNLVDSMNMLHNQPSQQAFAGQDCYGSTSRPFSGSGMVTGQGNTHCYVTEYDDGNFKTYSHSSPDGSYGVGFTWTFE